MRKSLKNKNYARLLGIIGQSKEALSISQIICKLKEVYPGSDWRYVYEMFDELCPSQIFTFGRRMFCASDLFSEDSDIRNKCSASLTNKLKKHQQQDPPKEFVIKDDPRTYPFFENNICKTSIEKEANGKTTKMIIKDYHNNSVVIERTLFHQPTESISNQSITMTIIYAPRYFQNLKRSYSPRVIFPLVLKKKGGKVYAHEGAIKVGNPAPLQYLIQDESKKYRLNFRGLVLFLLSENDFGKINAVLKNLSEVDADIELKKGSNGLSYSIKENFPFLSKHLTEFQKAIHEDFVPSHLKDIVKEVENKLDFIEIKELKYFVTRKYYAQIENYQYINGKLFYTRLSIIPQGFDPEPISIYKLSLLCYIRMNIEEDLFLVDEMITRNEGYLSSNHTIS